MLTPKEHTKSLCKRISHIGALPVNLDPVVSNVHTWGLADTIKCMNTHGHALTLTHLRVLAAREARYHSFFRFAGLKVQINKHVSYATRSSSIYGAHCHLVHSKMTNTETVESEIPSIPNAHLYITSFPA